MNWNRLMAAIRLQESSGNDAAVGDKGLAVGGMQIHPDVIVDVNNIYGLDFKPFDRLDFWQSRVIFVLYVSHYCRYDRIHRLADSCDYALCWHYGPSYTQWADPHGYWDAVKQHMDKG